MMLRLARGLAAAVAMLPAASGWAADLPAIRISDANKVPDCVTPGRLTAFLRARNDKLDPRFEKIAVEYMRRGEELGLRWDYTFYQMVLETGYLSYRGDRGRRGDVSPAQNNFAGIGATGGGVSGESFVDVSTGVLAHMQHVLLYAGETVDNPVAERTRKVQEWGILKSMQKKARGSVTFSHLATKWAPGADYVANLESIASRFHAEFCRQPDPNPEWVAEARGVKKPVAVAATPAPAPTAVAEPAAERISGAELARRAIVEGKVQESNRRDALGATGLIPPATPSYSLLNPSPVPAPEPLEEAAPTAPAAAPAAAATAPPARTAKAVAKPEREPPAFVTASAASAMAKATAPVKPAVPAAPAIKCRVWTASYGGQKAMIIRVRSDQTTDYTVLDVNEGAEKREADAYIAAYAKGGEIEAEFPSQIQALDKAFELCPEG